MGEDGQPGENGERVCLKCCSIQKFIRYMDH